MIYYLKKYRKVFVMSVVAASLAVISFPTICPAPPLPPGAGPYTSSAHGTIVNRDVMATLGYSQGNCAHCHEQHASVDGSEPAPVTGWPSPFALFADSTSSYLLQSTNFCFYCHISSGSVQNPAFSNYDYSKTFGGAAASVTGIQDAFNLLSNHNLDDLYEYITGTDAHGDTKSFADFPDSSSPCSGCHNVHIAKSNWSMPGNPVNTAISRPSDHGNLWGDDTTPDERMTVYGSNYQPPYYSSPNLEPDGASTDRALQAGKTPDYNTFCTDCHNLTNTIYSTTLSRNLIKIDWVTGDKHGQNSVGGARELKAPYSNSTGYVLSCLDCHEPHGSPNITLIRRRASGGNLAGAITALFNPPGTGTDDNNDDLKYLCERCHTSSWNDVHHNTPYSKTPGCACHNGSPATSPVACDKCHFHGSDDSWLGGLAIGLKTF